MTFLLLVLIPASQDDAAALVERLRSESPVERSEALTRLKALGEAALPALRAAEADPDPEVAGHAAFLVRRVDVVKRLSPALRAAVPGVEDRLATGDENAWTRLLQELLARRGRRPNRIDLDALAGPALRGARNDEERRQLCATCESMRFASATPELARLLKSPSPSVAEAALRALASLNAPEVLPECIRRLREGNEEARNLAVILLSRMRGRTVGEEAAQVLADPDARARRAAVRVLRAVARSDSAFVHGKLRGALGDADPQVRTDVVAALASTHAREAVPDLVKLLKEDAAPVRVAVLYALGQLQATQERAAVRAALADVDEGVRVAAIRTATALDDREAAGVVVGLLGDRFGVVRLEALKGLVGLRARAHGEAVVALLADPSAEVKTTAAWAVGRLGAASARPRLEAMLADPSACARLTAIAALRRLRATESAPALLRRLADEHPIVRGAALEAAAAIGRKDAADAVRALLKDPDPYVRASAALAAARLGLADTADALVGMLEDEADLEDSVYRNLREPDALLETPEVQALYEADLGTVRGAAAQALAVLGRKEGIAPLLEEADLHSVGRLTALNRFRSPELCEKLRAVKSDPDLPEEAIERLEEIAKRAGFRFEAEDRPAQPRALSPPPPGTLWEALLDATAESEFEVLLGGGVLKVVRTRTALRDWEDWWETQAAKEK